MSSRIQRMSSSRYRVDCTNCGWVGYRRNAYECECYEYPCRPTSPGMGCPNGANLYAVCPRCRNVRVTVEHNAPVAYFDRGKIIARAVMTRGDVARILRGRAKLRRERAAVGGAA